MASVRLDPRARLLASRLIDRLGLRRPVFRGREWLISRGDRRTETKEGEGPAPSPYLRTRVAGTPDLDWFLESGRRDADRFDAALRRAGGGLFDQARVLEWGCGCGRLSRWVAPRVPSFTGVDVDRRLLAWCSAHLPGRYEVNRPVPPPPLGAETFDVLYACSVITHLSQKSSRAWLAESARVLRSGGLALFSFHDAAHSGAPPVLELLGRDGWATRFPRLEGTNNYASYATIERLEALAMPALKLKEYAPSGHDGFLQAIAVFERR